MRISDWSSDVCSSDLLGEGQIARARSGRDDDVLRRNLGCLAVLRNSELALAQQLSVAFDDGDLVLLHQPLDAGIELTRDLARPPDHLREVDRRPFRNQAISIGAAETMENLRRAEQSLGDRKRVS